MDPGSFLPRSFLSRARVAVASNRCGRAWPLTAGKAVRLDEAEMIRLAAWCGRCQCRSQLLDRKQHRRLAVFDAVSGRHAEADNELNFLVQINARGAKPLCPV